MDFPEQIIISYMAEQQKEDSQKTVVSFIVGLLVGGLLVVLDFVSVIFLSSIFGAFVLEP